MTGHPPGVRRALNNAASRALAAGPPSRRTEILYVTTWLGTAATAGVLLWIGKRLR